jgi:hypothetical protein
MKLIQPFVALYFALVSYGVCEESKDFTLTIDGVEVGINLGDTVKTKSKNDQEVNVSLRRNEVSTFRGKGVAFQHKSGFSVATSAIDNDIEQHLLSSALGTVVIIQRYDSINPKTLTPLMLQELTKDGVNAGAKLESSDTSRKLGDGTDMTGIKATLTGKSEATNIEILVVGGNDEGFIAITQIDTSNFEIDQPILDQFWKTLSFKK